MLRLRPLRWGGDGRIEMSVGMELYYGETPEDGGGEGGTTWCVLNKDEVGGRIEGRNVRFSDDVDGVVRVEKG